MSPGAQRIAIAEACGFHQVAWDIPRPEPWWSNGKDYAVEEDDLPDYLNDLNAMHEAEELFYTDPEQSERYAEFMLDVLQVPSPFIGTARCAFLAGHATAAQRAEAFLRTINKWDDSK